MKQINFSSQTKWLLLPLLLLTLSVSNAWGTDVSSTFTSQAGAVGTNEPTWTVASATGYEADRGVAWNQTTGSLTNTSLSSYTITEIQVDASTNSAVNNGLSVTVGGSAFGSTQNITKENHKTYTFTGSASGNIVVSIAQASSKTVWIKTITITYSSAPAVQHTITWVRNGVNFASTDVNEGSKPTFPSPAPTSCDETSTTFIGWTQTPWTGKIDDISGKTLESTKVYTDASQMPAVAEDVTYHAVFAKGSANTYVKATKADLTDGQTVLIVNPSALVALKGDKSALGISILSNKITTASTAVLWTVEPHGSGYYFKYGSDYLNSYNGSLYIDNYTDEWSISGSGPYILTSGNQSTKSLQYYGSAWKMYNTGSTAYFQMDFYILEAPTQYLTTCCDPLASINGSHIMTKFLVIYLHHFKVRFAVLLSARQTHYSSYRCHL